MGPEAPFKVILFVPCFNVAATVAGVLDRIPASVLERVSEVLLVDNGSSDGTRPLLESYVAGRGKEKFRLLYNEQNYSLGGSAIIAIRESLARGADFLICLHSDGQAEPADVERFFPLSPDEDFVFGSRLLPGSRTGAYSRLRKCANVLFARLQQLILRQEIFDIGALVGMNLHSVARVPYYRISADMAYFPSLVLYMAGKGRLRCREFPIHWGGVVSSNVNVWSYGLQHLFRLLRMGFGTYRLTEAGPAQFRSVEWQGGSAECR